jgi:hypothetical protein
VSEIALPSFEARYSVVKMAGWLLLTTPLLVGALGMAWGGLMAGHALTALIGILGTAFFGMAALGVLRCLIDRRVQLRVDAKGLYLRPHSDKVIPLRSIRGFTVATGMLKLRFYKPSKFPIESRWRRFVYRINGSFAPEYFGNAWIWTWHFDCNWKQINDAINAHVVPTAFEQDLAARMQVGRE